MSRTPSSPIWCTGPPPCSTRPARRREHETRRVDQRHLREQAGKHFEPRLVELFISVLPQVLEVRERFLEAG